MEVESCSCNDQEREISFQNQEFVPVRVVIPITICDSWPHLGLRYLGFGPFSPQFGPFYPHFAGPVGLGMDPDVLIQKELQRSRSLLLYMADELMVPSPEEEFKRKNIILKLKQIVMKWVKGVAYERRLPKNRIRAASATILTFGSYGLGVHNAESDVDALCIAPYFATLTEDFFIGLYNILSSRSEVTEIYCIKDAKVPLMKFKFDGVSIDLPFAQLKVISVPEDVDLFNPFFLRNIDDISWRSLSGIRANKSILRLVPNIELFQSLLRCMKFWANRRGVYGHLLGYFGGVHLAVLAAFICQRHPNASFCALMSIFFKTFAHWPWPTPVSLDGRMVPQNFPTDVRFLMPIQLPCSPNQYCHCNITRSTFYRIKGEFIRGNAIIQDVLSPDFSWSSLFDPFPHAKKYAQFVKICLSSSDHDSLGQWIGWVKSRFRSLLVKLEDLLGFCDPNPKEYVDITVAEPHVIFFWGLQPVTDAIDLEFVSEEFMKNIRNGYQGPSGGMKLAVVQASQLPRSSPCRTVGKGSKVQWRVIRKIPEPEKHPSQGFAEVLAAENENVEYHIAGCEAASLDSPLLQTVV